MQILQEDGEFDFCDVPLVNVKPPESDFTAGIQPRHIKSLSVRAKYLAAIDSNMHKADRFAQRWKRNQLRKTYGNFAAKFILKAYGEEPFNLHEMHQLLNELLDQTGSGTQPRAITREQQSPQSPEERDVNVLTAALTFSDASSAEKPPTKAARSRKPKMRSRRKK